MSARLARLLVELLATAGLVELALALVDLQLDYRAPTLRQALVHAALLLGLAGPLMLWRCLAFARAVKGTRGALPASRSRPAWIMTGAALLLGLGLSIWLADTMQKAIWGGARMRFERQVELVEAEIARRFVQPIYGLNGARGMYATGLPIGRDAFGAYVASRDLPAEFPGVRGFGFIRRVMRPDLERFAAATRADGAPQFEVRTSGNAPDLYVITFIEPLQDNRAALGLDVGAEPVRRQAVEQALATGQFTLSAPITLVDARQGPGFLYLLPLFRVGMPQGSIEQRKAALQGYLYAAIVASEILGGAASISLGQIEFALVDAAVAPAQQRIFATAALADRERDVDGGAFDATRTLRIGGRDFALAATSSATFDADIDRSTPLLIRVGGTLLSVLLAFAIWLLGTGRARAELRTEGISNEADRLAEVVRYTSNSVVITDRDRNITWINGGFTRIYGYSAEEALGRTPQALLGSDLTDPAAYQTMREAAAAGTPCRVEVINRAKDGRTRWIELEIQPRHDARGVLTGFMQIGLDINERKLAEQRLADALQALTRERERLDRIVEGTNAGTWEWNLKTGEVRCNQRWAGVLGYTLEELAPITIQTRRELGHPDDLARAADLVRQHLRGELDYLDCEIRMRHRQGHWVCLLERGRVSARDTDGRALWMAGTHMDISTLKHAEEQLRTSNTVLQSILDNLPCGLSVFDGQLRLVAHNRLFRSLLDLPDALFEGPVTRFEDIMRHNAARGEYGPGPVEEVVARIVEAARHPVRMLHERQRHDGLAMENRSAPMPGGGFVTTYMDISERKQVERLKNEFISTVSHELRTPLTSIHGSLSVLASGMAGELAPDVLELVSLSLRSSERLIRLINDVLDVEKIESRRMSYTMVAQSLAPLIDQAIDATRHYADQYGVHIDFETRIDAVAAAVDADRIVQVLVNLLSNAVKFSERGQRVAVRMALPGDRVRVSVVDRGMGIPEEFRGRIFERFSQLDSSDRRQKGGTGLGLNICRSIVLEHRGRIDFVSAPGAGSEFFFDLPVMPGR